MTWKHEIFTRDIIGTRDLIAHIQRHYLPDLLFYFDSPDKRELTTTVFVREDIENQEGNPHYCLVMLDDYPKYADGVVNNLGNEFEIRPTPHAHIDDLEKAVEKVRQELGRP
ncbi:MAG: hypothetical protein ABII01_02175 [Candidatus Woesearchaeota archaeon]